MRDVAAACAVVAVLLSSTRAGAQLRYDVGALAGASEHCVFDRPAGVGMPTPGPSLLLDGHVAVFPLLRVGAYAEGDVTDLDAPAPRWTLGGGLRLKITPPWPRGKWRAWLATGFGYVGAYSPAAISAPAAGGGAFEIPVALGASYRFRKPWVLLGELGTRFAFGHWGSLYETRGPDLVTVGLSIGIGIDS